MTIGKTALSRQHQFPEKKLSVRDCEPIASTLQGLVNSPIGEAGKDVGKNTHTKKQCPSVFLESSVPEYSVITSPPRMPSNVGSGVQALCRDSIKTINGSLHEGTQPYQISIMCTSAYSKRVKLPRL